MRNVLLLCWALGLGGHYGELAAQTRAAGPWRVVNQPIRYKPNEEWGGAAEWGEKPSPTANADTTTAVRVQRKLYRVRWNVHPDSITLLLGCQNPLLAPTAPRSRLAPVRFMATGATVRLDAKQRLLLLAPSDSVVVVWAYRGQQLVFRHEFKAVPPPLPTVKCFSGDCDATICKGPYKKPEYIRTVTLRAIPDPDFAAILPEDARYRVARFRATLLRQVKAVETAPGQLAEKTIQGPQGDMSDLASVSQLGDQLQLDVLLVQRMNSQGIITEVPALKRFIIAGLKCPE